MREGPRKAGRRGRAVGFGIGMGLLVLAGGEAALRGVGVGRAPERTRSRGSPADVNPARVFLRGEGEAAFSPEESPYRFPDPLLGWSLRPSYRMPPDVRGKSRQIQDLVTNRLGLRGPEVSPVKEEGVTRILCLGDSVTFGFGEGIREVDPFPRRLESWLEATFPGRAFEVLNAGVPGYTAVQGAIRYGEELAGLEADVVTVGFGVNEFDVAPAPDRVVLHRPAWRRHLETWLRGFSIVRLLRGWLAAGTDHRAALVSRASEADYRASVRAILRRAREAGAKVLLLQTTFFWPRWKTVAGWNRSLAESEGIPWLDLRKALLDAAREGPRDPAEEERFARYRRMQQRLAPRIPGYPALSAEERSAFVFMVDRVHPNALGHARIAEVLGRDLVARGWVPLGSDAAHEEP